MRRITYVVWALWLIVGIGLKIIAGVSWWLALSALWFPLAVYLSVTGAMVVVADIGERTRKKTKIHEPETCGNCLFGQTCDIINSVKQEGEERTRCIGERIGNAERGKVCEYYQRAN